MKKAKKLCYALFCVAIIATSCSDEFSEEDHANRLEAQKTAKEAKEAAEEAANAAALAGVNLDYTVTVHSNEAALSGVAITITALEEGTTLSQTTDESGTVSFSEISLGGHTVAITSEEHLNVSYQVDFGNPKEGVHYEIIDEKVFNLNTIESSKIPLFELGGVQTATIKGKVEIETDLTNRLPEVPEAGIVVRANLDGNDFEGSHSANSSESGTQNSIYVAGSFSFAQGDIGEAAVDPATGAYSMNVPATAKGTTIELLLPLVEADQTLAFSKANGENVGVQVGTAPAHFGPNIKAADVPDIAGASATFPAPPPAGRGFSLTNFQARHTDLLKEVGLATINTFPIESEHVGIRFRGSQGNGYQTTPEIEIDTADLSGIFATDAIMGVTMHWDFQTITIDAGGSGYGSDIDVAVELEAFDADNDQLTLYSDKEMQNEILDITLTTLTTNNQGEFPVGDFPVNGSLQEAYTDSPVAYFALVFPDNGNFTKANGSLGRSGSVNTFEIIDDGRGYTTIPEITVSGGSPVTPATLEITHMSFEYYFDLDNSNVTQSYVMLPTIEFEYEPIIGVKEFEEDVALNSIDDLGWGQYFTYRDNLQLALKVSGDAIVFDDDNLLLPPHNVTVDKGRMRHPSFSPVTVIVKEPVHTPTTANITINADGEVTGLNGIVVGSGYPEQYQLTLNKPSSGKAAIIELTGFTTDARTGEVTWNGDYIITDKGSGYRAMLNIDKEDFSGDKPIIVKNGETKIVNINYGTGELLKNLE